MRIERKGLDSIGENLRDDLIRDIAKRDRSKMGEGRWIDFFRD
jgi:hypothetical protein